MNDIHPLINYMFAGMSWQVCHWNRWALNVLHGGELLRHKRITTYMQESSPAFWKSLSVESNLRLTGWILEGIFTKKHIRPLNHSLVNEQALKFRPNINCTVDKIFGCSLHNIKQTHFWLWIVKSYLSTTYDISNVAKRALKQYIMLCRNHYISTSKIF